MQKHEEWMLFAEQDLKVAKKLINDEEPILNPAAYHCQQSIEKILKAYLAYQKQPIKKTHDLIKLIELCMFFDKDFINLKEISSDLNPYASKARYPDSMFIMPDLTTFKIILKETEAAFDFVKNLMIE